MAKPSPSNSTIPKGDPRNPLTDQEIEEKFAALADGVLSTSAQKKLKDAIWNLEKLSSVTKLMALMKADVRAKKSNTHQKRRAQSTEDEPPPTVAHGALGCRRASEARQISLKRRGSHAPDHR